MIKKTIIISLLLIVCLTTFGQTDKEYSKTLKKMFKASGTEESYTAVLKQMFTMFKQQYTNVEPVVWSDLEKEFQKTSLNDLTKMLTPVYSKHLTLKDLKEIIVFYDTPVGKKLAKKTPLIMQESMQVGQQWGAKIVEDIMKKIKEKGY